MKYPISLLLLDKFHDFLTDFETEGRPHIWSCDAFRDAYKADPSVGWSCKCCTMRAIKFVRILAVCLYNVKWSGTRSRSDDDIQSESDAEWNFGKLEAHIVDVFECDEHLAGALDFSLWYIANLRNNATDFFERLEKLPHAIAIDGIVFDEFIESVMKYVTSVSTEPLEWGHSPHDYTCVEGYYDLTLRHLKCLRYLLCQEKRLQSGACALILSVLCMARRNDLGMVDSAEMEERILACSLQMSLKLSPFHSSYALEEFLQALSRHEGSEDSFLRLLQSARSQVNVLGYILACSQIDLTPVETLMKQVDRILTSFFSPHHHKLMQRLSFIKAEHFVMATITSFGTMEEALAFLTDEFFRMPTIHMADKEKLILQLILHFLRETAASLRGSDRVSEDMILESSLAIFKLCKAQSILLLVSNKSYMEDGFDTLHKRSTLQLGELLSGIQISCQSSRKIEVNLEELIAVYEHGSISLFNEFIKSDRVVFADHLTRKLRNLLTNRPHTFALIKDQLVTMLGELEVLGSFLKDFNMEAAENKDTLLQVICVIYEAKYILDMFLRGDSPLWYQQLLIFNAILEIKLISKYFFGMEKSEDVTVGLNDQAKIIVDLSQNGYRHLEASHHLKNGFQDEGAKEYWRNHVYQYYVQDSSVHWSTKESTVRAKTFLKTIQCFYNTDLDASDVDEQLAVQCHRRQGYLRWLHGEIHYVCGKKPQHLASTLSESFGALGLLRIKFGDTCDQLMKVPLPARFLEIDMFDAFVDSVIEYLMQRNYKATMQILGQFGYSVSSIAKLCRDQKRLQCLLVPAVTLVSSIQQMASGEMEENLFPSALEMSRLVLCQNQEGSDSFLNLLQAAQNLARIIGGDLNSPSLDLIADEPYDRGNTYAAKERLIADLILSFLKETGSLDEFSEDKILELSHVIVNLSRDEALIMVLSYNSGNTYSIDKISLFFRELVSGTPDGNLRDDYVSRVCVKLADNAASVCSFEEMTAVYMRDLLWWFNNFPRSDGVFFAEHLLEKLSKFATNYLSDSVSSMKDSFQAFLRDLELFITFISECKNKDLELRVTFFLYATEYIIDMFMHGNGPVCYHQLVLLLAFENAEFIKEQIRHHGHDKEASESQLRDAQVALRNDASKGSNLKTEEVVVGFDDHAKNIMELLETGSHSLQVVSIVGMAGIGKTTLAKKVYNALLSKGRFAVCAGSSISQVYRKRELLLDILGDSSTVTDGVKKKDDDDLALMVYQSLKGKRYLIVLDDIWMIEHWDDLKVSFPDDKKGSRILFTTRVRSVADASSTTIKPYYLPLLSLQQSWELLQEKVFSGGRCPKKLHEVGRLVAEHCKGLPLAIVVIAGILEKVKEQEDKWEEIAAHLRSRVADNEETQFMSILELSYNHLPSYLKPCFLYLGSFLEDQEIPVKKLQWLWMGEGFIPRKGSKSLEETAGRYLVELINRSLIMESKRCSLGSVKTCRIHDMLRDLCLKKSREENFMQLIAIDDPDKSELSTDMLYRICVHSPKQNLIQLRPSDSHVHSLLYFATNNSQDNKSYDVSSVVQDSKLLRVLDLEAIQASVFPGGIASLLCLNYLAIKGNIRSIPESIAKLWSLETLIVKGTRGEVAVPSLLWSMAVLRNAHIRPRACLTFSKPELENATEVENLTTFSSPVFSDKKVAEKILKRLIGLRNLRCVFLEQTDSSGKCNVFPEMDFLIQLESLNIYYIGKIFPCKFSFPLNIKKLTLSRFCLKWDYMNEISKLLHLEVLKLLFKAFDGDVWDMSEEVFPKLRVLLLENLNLSYWHASDCSDCFPELERLVLRSCKKLEEVPSSLGDISTLQQIEVQWCTRSASESVQPIYEQQVEYGNPDFDVTIFPSEWNFRRSTS